MQSDNFTQELKDAGLRAPSELDKVWDVNAGIGGPIMRDRLWFFGTARTQGSYVSITDTFFNKNEGDPTKWTYEPDLSRQSVHGRRVEELVAAADVAGDAAQQVHGVLGRAGRVPFLRRRRQSDGRARGVGAHRRPVDARVSGGVDRTAVEPIAGRGRRSRGWDSATAASATATTGT